MTNQKPRNQHDKNNIIDADEITFKGNKTTKEIAYTLAINPDVTLPLKAKG